MTCQECQRSKSLPIQFCMVLAPLLQQHLTLVSPSRQNPLNFNFYLGYTELYPNTKAQSRRYQLGVMGHGPFPWTLSWAAGSRRLCLSRRIGPGDLQRSLLTSATLIIWLCGVPWTNGIKDHWDFHHFLLHWKGHMWEGVLGVCGDVSRISSESTDTDRTIGGFWFPVLQAEQAAARACCPTLH